MLSVFSKIKKNAARTYYRVHVMFCIGYFRVLLKQPIKVLK